MKSYTVEEKLKAIDTAKKKSKHSAARLHNVCVKRIREWCQNEEKLRSVANKKKVKRLSGAGRPFKCERLEHQLIDWIEAQRKQNLRVSRQMTQKKAKELFNEINSNENSEEFSASNGWLMGFLKRNCLTIRKRTTVSQKTPEDIADRVVSYLVFIEGLRRNCGYRDSCIGAADETAIWIDPLQDHTIEKIGKKTISLFSTGNHKAKLSVTLAAMADGRKLLPFIVLKGKRIPTELLNFPNAVIRMSDNGWNNENTTLDWITTVWGSLSFGRRLLSWDAFRCHKTPTVKAKLKKMATDVAMIPGKSNTIFPKAKMFCYLTQPFDFQVAAQAYSRPQMCLGTNPSSPHTWVSTRHGLNLMVRLL